MKQNKTYQAGLDIGSTTAKIVLINENCEPVFSAYQRHNARIFETVSAFFSEILSQSGNCLLNISLTGSAGMGLAGKLDLPFVQEVICANEVIQKQYPDVRTVVDIGGEDSKMIFFSPGRPPDIRMNGSCAGGTGAFIDQLASLLNRPVDKLNRLAADHTRIYPIASRCGVFAKTDVQNLLSRNVPLTDIAASVFHAVAVQCLNTLARGVEIKPHLLLCGGVFAFIPQLVDTFLNVLDLSAADQKVPPRPELLPAIGAAILSGRRQPAFPVKTLLDHLESRRHQPVHTRNRLSPLFKNKIELNQWKKNAGGLNIAQVPLREYAQKDAYIGIDSGSTTTKIVVIGAQKQVLFSWYHNNEGNPIKTVIQGLSLFHELLKKEHPDLKIMRTAVAGYGEDLIKTAFGMDTGVVETIAHYEAARYIEPDVSFILDIGGQDMKAIFIRNGVIHRIELNEACSSGCGSFIETFAHSLDYEVAQFASMALTAGAPCDLGTRCTVFMNSKVKQSLRENASVEEISAGLSYSVIKNCLFKVLKLNNMSELGDHIVLQGGTFKNPSIVRALEILSGRDVKYSSMPEMMGAFGAALIAHKEHTAENHPPSTFLPLSDLDRTEKYTTRQIQCSGCENTCAITQFKFPNGQSFYSGNKCEKIFSAGGALVPRGFDFSGFKYDLLFDRDLSPHGAPVLTLGIPRCLNFYENFPFWHALFVHCGINIKLSAASTMELCDKAMGSIMSDNICFPAKLANGHILNLVEQGVDRIFYPLVMYEKKEFKEALNSFNCPIVSSYADVLDSSLNTLERYGIPLDKPVITFQDQQLLINACIAYLTPFAIPKRKIRAGVEVAVQAQEAFRQAIATKGAEIVLKAKQNQSLLVVLAGRPYHIDPLINHKIPEILTGLGVDIITEDAVPRDFTHVFEDLQVVTQWAYPNRLYYAAHWVARQPDHVQMVHLNSFGCGPDAVVIDETRQVLQAGTKNYTLVKIDEISSMGSTKLRLRSMIESLKRQTVKGSRTILKRRTTPSFEIEDRKRTILAPFFSQDYSGYLAAIFESAGYRFEILPGPDKESVELGLRYASNDICYPGTLVIGDIIKALKSGKYSRRDIAVGITQTGGQCRASNYLALIRKAMISAGYEDIPIISVTASKGLTHQPGFDVNWLMMTKILFITTMYADCIAKMYYSTVVREKQKGMSAYLKSYYIEAAYPCIMKRDYNRFFALLEEAVTEFNQMEIHDREIPKIGIVGEIYIKYNYFGNQFMADWLIEHGVEPVIPPILDYFTQDLVNYKENIKANIRVKKLNDLLGQPIEIFINAYHKKINRLFKRFRYATPFHDIRSIAKKAGRILSLVNQFGEGWLVPGEIACFAEEGVNNVLSVQPFGCIANHIISKGIEARIKSIYPDMNLLFLDFDAGTSEVNIQNRLHFMVEAAKASCRKKLDGTTAALQYR